MNCGGLESFPAAAAGSVPTAKRSAPAAQRLMVETTNLVFMLDIRESWLPASLMRQKERAMCSKRRSPTLKIGPTSRLEPGRPEFLDRVEHELNCHGSQQQTHDTHSDIHGDGAKPAGAP